MAETDREECIKYARLPKWYNDPLAPRQAVALNPNAIKAYNRCMRKKFFITKIFTPLNVVIGVIAVAAIYGFMKAKKDD